MGGAHVAADPTPRRPLMLQILARAPMPAIYVGRPCYFETRADPGCTPELWTSARYSDAVVASLAAVINGYVERGGFERVILAGIWRRHFGSADCPARATRDGCRDSVGKSRYSRVDASTRLSSAHRQSQSERPAAAIQANRGIARGGRPRSQRAARDQRALFPASAARSGTAFSKGGPRLLLGNVLARHPRESPREHAGGIQMIRCRETAYFSSSMASLIGAYLV